MKKITPNRRKGFTIIEMLIYISVYSILISGVLISVYAIKESSARNQSKAFVIQEGIFLTSKISWALSGATSVTIPNTNKIIINRNNLISADNPLNFEISNSEMTLSRGNKNKQPLHDPSFKILNPSFARTVDPGNGTNLEKVTVSFTVSTLTKNGHPYSQDFSFTKYIRQ